MKGWYNEYKSKTDKKSSMRGYLDITRPHLHMINHLKKCGAWKTQQTMKPKFKASTDTNQKHTMHSKNGSSIVMIGNDIGQTIQEDFNSFLHKYKKYIEQYMNGGNFIFGCISGMHNVGNKISINHSGSSD